MSTHSSNKSDVKGESQIKAWTEHYAAARPLHVQFTQKLRALIEDLVSGNAIDIHLLESRTKEAASFQEKISRSSKSYNDPLKEITDFVGIRIIAYYQEDVDAICRIIENEFDVDPENSGAKSGEPSEFGYKSVHYVVRLPSSRRNLSEWKQLSSFCAEIQVRTVLQHSWAAISHKLQYKREADIPTSLKRKLFRLSALLELADDEFVALRNASGALSKSIEVKLSAGEKNIEIDILSIEEFIKRSDDVAHATDVALRIGFKLTSDDPAVSPEELDETETFSSLAGLAKLAHVQNIGELESAIRKARPRLKDYLSKQYGKDKHGNWIVSPAFLCVLILVGTFPDKIRATDLMKMGWDRGIALRVVSTAKKYPLQG